MQSGLHIQKTKKYKTKLNALNTNQRTLKNFLLSKTKLIDGRIYFQNKMFVPYVVQLKLRFIQSFMMTQLQGTQGKQKHSKF